MFSEVKHSPEQDRDDLVPTLGRPGTKWSALCILFYDGVEIISRMFTEQVYFCDC